MRAETAAGAMGFVDVLVGAMAAVVLLFMAQAARPPAKPGFGVGGPRLRIEVDAAKTKPPLPGLAVRYRLRRSPVPLSAGDLRAAGERRLAPLQSDDGATVHVIQLGEGAVFDDGELLLVYLNDLNGRRPDAPVVVRAVLSAGGTEAPWQLDLTAADPVRVKRLGTLSGQRKGDAGDWEKP